MTAQKLINSRRLGLALFFALALNGCGQPSSNPQPSGSAVDANTEEPLFAAAGEEAPQDGIMNDEEPRLLRKRSVRVNFKVLTRAVERAIQEQAADSGSATLRLNLFNDQDVLIRMEQVQRLSEKNIVIVGRVVGDEDSAVTLVMKDGVLVANVRRADREEAYEVRYTGGGLHAVQMPLESHEDDCSAVVADDQDSLVDDQPMMDGEPGTDGILSSSVIDILAVYTPSARSKQGGTAAMEALIQMGIADTNRALEDSGSSLSVRLVGTKELRTNETGNFSADLNALRKKTDGRWDEVHAERARVGADQVSLIGSFTSSRTTAGIGYIRASYSTAFTVTKASGFSQYTFSHELGHNLGLNHDDGYVNSSGRFRTIIAYGSYPRIRRFANPDLTYKGFKTGDSRHDEISIINRSATRVSSLAAARVMSAEAEITASDAVEAAADKTQP